MDKVKLNKEQINISTRDIYHQQHKRMLDDEVTINRLMSITSEEFFKVEPGFFSNKKILDAGCGSIIRNAIAFYQMGSRDVTAMDIGSEWFDTARINMSNYSIPKDGIRLISGNVVELPFNNEEFNFVCCDGVLPHLADLEQVELAIKELGRVTSHNGYLFISYMAGGGIIETRIHDALRDAYKESIEFANIIDNLKPEILWSLVDFIKEKLEIHNNYTFDANFIKSMLDEDYCISIQNTCQAQKRDHHSQDYINNLLINAGFKPPIRLTRYVKRNNIRKFMAPFHYYHDNAFAKILYGDGWVDCITQKTK